MDLRRIQRRKLILIIVIAVTAALPMYFVRFNEPTPALQVFKFFAKAGSLCGTVLIVWQFLLGFRAIAGRFLQDLIWVLNLHKSVGKYALILIALHPVFITLYYVVKKGSNPLLLEGGRPFSGYVLLGEIAFGLFVVIVVTSVFLRKRISFSTWYGFHLSSYVALPLVFVHSIPVGMTLNASGLYYVWVGLLVLVAGLFVLRFLFRLGIFSFPYEVSMVENVGPCVVKISSRPLAGKIRPKTGQFIYFRRGVRGAVRPFTVSHYDGESGELSITVKALGKTTTSLQSIKTGEKVYIQGPYGVFSHAAIQNNSPLVMIAGGIGITPFVRLFEELAHEPGRELHLFYGNKNADSIVYKSELDNVEHVNVIHVLSEEPGYTGEKGFVTTDLLKRYLKQPLVEYEFLICGPPVMTSKLKKALAKEDVPQAQIHHELFSY